MAGVLAGWDVHSLPGGTNNFGTSPLAATTTDPNVTVGGLTRGTGVGTTGGSGAARAWGGNDWLSASEAAAISAGDYGTFTVTASGGHSVSISSISHFDYRRSATGAASGELQYQIGGGAFVDAASLAYPVNTSTGGSISAIDLSGVAALQNVPAGTTITFRIVNWGGSNTTGTWYIWDLAGTAANDFEVSGTVGVGGSPVNGACGSANGGSFTSAPTTNLCSVGTPSSVTGSGPWNWTCAGSNGGTTASCSASLKVAGQPFTIFHMNDTHARITPHDWVIAQHGTAPDTFERVGGAAYLAGEMMSLVNGNPTALVLDGGDISEGNPIGDMNCTSQAGQTQPTCQNNGFGNGGMTAFYSLLHQKLAAIGGTRGTRGIDALVVGNHDVRDISYITNMEQMHATGVPVISVNVRDISTHQPHFAATTTVTVNGVKIGIVGYTTSSAAVGASLASTLEVVDCQWTGASNGCNIADYVNDLRNNQGCDVVILLTHDGHSDLVDPSTPVIADTVAAKVPEIAITGHWHTWAESVWQPAQLNYKTTFMESSSYMKYIGELNVAADGTYVSSVQHVLRNADITPDPDVAALVQGMIDQFNAAHPTLHVDGVIGYSNDNLLLDNRMKWWSADEYPWDGNNSAGQWITDGMKWKCDHIAWPSGGGCDLAIEAGGGVRSDIPAGPMTYIQAYETYPWADDTYVRVKMTGQDIINFLNATNLDTGFSGQMDVTAFDGIITSVLMNGQPIGLSTVYKVAVNNYMIDHPPSGYVWPGTIAAEADPSGILVRDSLIEFMQQAHNTQQTAYSVGGDRYHFNGKYAGGFRAVVTMMNDHDSEPQFDDAFIRLLSANDETLSRRGSPQVPTSILNADGSVNGSNRLAEQELYRSFLGFKTGALMPGDIIQVWGKSSFFGGDPEFVDQEGVYGNAQEFLVLGHDPTLAQAVYMPSIGAFFGNSNYKNHYVHFLATRTGASTVVDQHGTPLTVMDRTGFASASLPGTNGQTLDISGVVTMESFGYRFRSDTQAVTSTTLPASSEAASHVDMQPVSTIAPSINLTATAAVSAAAFTLEPVADAQVASGNPNSNSGTTTNLFLQGTTATGTFGIERDWLKFDVSGIPAGTTITGATLQLYNWKSTGPSMPAEVHAVSTDSWTETGITYNNQPVLGAVLDTQTLVSGVTNKYYSWNVASFVQGELNGDKTVSLMVKAVDENQAGGPSYGFDAKEFTGTHPLLVVTTSANASSVASLSYFYRYSADDQTNWTAWTATGASLSATPYNQTFNFPNGPGYYEFYSVATDNLGHSEPTPAFAQASVHFQVATGTAQTITFGSLPSTPVGSTFSLAATASSALPVSYSSLTSTVCSVSGNQVTTLSIGTCNIAADQAGNVGVWLAAGTVTRNFQITGLSQTISFDTFPPLVQGGTAQLGATATSGLTVTFSSQTASVCTVSGTVVTALQLGTCTIAADQAGNSFWLAATTVTRSVTVNTAGAGGGTQPQTITFDAIPDRGLFDGSFAASATASSGLTVTFASQTTNVCRVNGRTIVPVASGVCTLVASQVGDATYAAAQNVGRSFNVTQPDGSQATDAPLPLWAVVLLALGMIGIVYRRRGGLT